jgi:hypothetical protein
MKLVEGSGVRKHGENCTESRQGSTVIKHGNWVPADSSINFFLHYLFIRELYYFSLSFAFYYLFLCFTLFFPISF